jgi:polyhydroxybutyrate depolymerase
VNASAGTPASAGMMAASTAGSGAPPSSTGTPDRSAGCGMAPPASDTSIMVNGMMGTLIVDVPKSSDNNRAYPLILVCHGFNVTAPMFHDYLTIHAAAGDDAIVVTPECLNGGTMWPADMSYPDALLEHFEAKYCVDKSRIFTTGYSMGGKYTGQIGCQRGDKFRGDAVLAAPHASGNCVKGKMAAMMSVGMSDTVADYMIEFSYWSMYGGCDISMKSPVDPMSFYTKALDEAGSCVDYGGCAAATPIRTCTFAGGHEIPPWVAGAVWNFFKKL